MGKRLFLALALCLAAPLGGCLGFAHSVVDVPAPNDPRLLGYWESGEKNEKVGFLVEESTPHSLRVTMRDLKACKDESFEMFRTEIDGRWYLRLDVIDEKTNRIDPDMQLPVAYDIVDGTDLYVYLPVDDVIMAAVKSGALDGVVSTDSYFESVRVTASALDLRTYLAAHPEAMEQKGASPLSRKPMPSARPCAGPAK